MISREFVAQFAEEWISVWNNRDLDHIYNLMEGYTEIDHEKHTKDFTERMKRIVTKQYLETVCQAIPG